MKRPLALLTLPLLLSCIPSVVPVVPQPAPTACPADRPTDSASQQVEALDACLYRRAFPTGLGPARRLNHARHHGCVRAVFQVLDKVPEELRRGVFQKPGRVFDAWIRFSNGLYEDDREADSRGMAIKLLAVQGTKLLPDEPESQDFVLINHRVFLFRDASQYQEYLSLVKQGDPFGYFRKPEHQDARAILKDMLSHRTESLLDESYYSQTAYRLGRESELAVKYVVTPIPPSATIAATAPVAWGPQVLRERLAAALHTGGALLEFAVQVRPKTAASTSFPIDDPMVEWQVPATSLATITIPPQTFTSQEDLQKCEERSFNPWHALTVHQPLGAINELRRDVYRGLSYTRHRQSHGAVQAPSANQRP